MVVENLDSEKMTWRENDVTCNAITSRKLENFRDFCKKTVSEQLSNTGWNIWGEISDKVFFQTAKVILCSSFLARFLTDFFDSSVGL